MAGSAAPRPASAPRPSAHRPSLWAQGARAEHARDVASIRVVVVSMRGLRLDRNTAQPRSRGDPEVPGRTRPRPGVIAILIAQCFPRPGRPVKAARRGVAFDCAVFPRPGSACRRSTQRTVAWTPALKERGRRATRRRVPSASGARQSNRIKLKNGLVLRQSFRAALKTRKRMTRLGARTGTPRASAPSRRARVWGLAAEA